VSRRENKSQIATRSDPGGAKRRRILTYLTKVRTLCARAYGAPTIRGQIMDSYLSFLPTRVH